MEGFKFKNVSDQIPPSVHEIHVLGVKKLGENTCNNLLIDC